jgi:NADH-quinone oxidoreductase subunit I
MFGWGILKGLFGVTLKHFINTYVDDARYWFKKDLKYLFRSVVDEEAFARRQGTVGAGLFTVEYPEMKLKPPENFRFLPFLVTDYEVLPDSPDFDREKWTELQRCTACGICSKVCPPQCIWIVRSKDPETGKPVTKPAEFYIDADICMNCGYCAEFCPFDAIKMDHNYELSDYERKLGHIHDLERLTRPTSYYASIRPTWNALEEETRRKAEEEKRRKAEEKERLAAEKAAAKAGAKATATVGAAAKGQAGVVDKPKGAKPARPQRSPEEIKAQREAMLAKKQAREAEKAAQAETKASPDVAKSAKTTTLVTVEGIGEVYSQKLKDIGISTTEDLLEKGGTPKGRKEIAEQSEISPKLILRWVNMVDLFRIKGVGEEYADLLEAAGVDTVPELAQRNAENLYQKLVETNEAKKLTRQVPGQDQVKAWVEQAKELPRKITY